MDRDATDSVDTDMIEKGTRMVRTFCNSGVDNEMNKKETEIVWTVWTVR